jgi:hypothetical protein
MSADQIAVLADRVLRSRLGSLGLDRVDVTEGEDHDGDPALFIAAHYREGSRAPDGDTLLDALGALWRAIRESGETRVFYLDHRFSVDDGDQEEDEYGADT